jgi:peroxiredoxin
MLPLLLLLAAQSPADTDADKLLAGIPSLMGDPYKNAEEIDRRFTAAKKLYDENPSSSKREALANWIVRMGPKCARTAESLPVAKDRLKTKPAEARALPLMYFEALHAAVLAMKSEEVLSILKAWAKEEPQAAFLHNREQMEKEAAMLGRSAPAISAPPVEGTKFSWSSGTREKIVILYFAGSSTSGSATPVGKLLQMSKKVADADDVALVAVSLDADKTTLGGLTKQLTGWSVLWDPKGVEARSAKDYGIKGIPGAVLIDARGRIRLGESLGFVADQFVEDLRLEAFWAKKRGTAPAVAASKPDGAPPSPASAQAGVKWLFLLKNGGKLNVVSYEEKEGKFLLKLAVGSTTVSEDDVVSITPVDPR